MRKSIFFIAFIYCFIHSWLTCAQQTPQDESPALPATELDEVVIRGKQYKSDTIRQLLNGFFNAKEMVHGYQAYRLMTNDDLVQVFSDFEQSTGIRILPKSYVDFPSIWFTMYKNKAWADYEEAAQGRTRYLTNEIVFQPMTDGTYEIDLRVTPSGSAESENKLTQLVIDAKKEIVQREYWQNTYFNRPKDARESVITGHGELYSGLKTDAGQVEVDPEKERYYLQVESLLNGPESSLKQDLNVLWELYNFYAQCESQQWASYSPKGVIPYCLWKDQTSAKIPFISGMVDAAYQDVEGLSQIPLLIEMIRESTITRGFNHPPKAAVRLHGGTAQQQRPPMPTRQPRSDWLDQLRF